MRKAKMKRRSRDRGPPSLNLLWVPEAIGIEKLLWISIPTGRRLQGSQLHQLLETRGSGYRRNGPFQLGLRMVGHQQLLI